MLCFMPTIVVTIPLHNFLVCKNARYTIGDEGGCYDPCVGKKKPKPVQFTTLPRTSINTTKLQP